VRRQSRTLHFSLRLAIGVPTVAALGTVLAMPAQATSAAFALQPASAIVTQARAAMAAAGSVSAVGRGSGTASGVGKLELSEQDYSAATSGVQQLKMTSNRSSKADFTASTIVFNGQVYVDANAAFWVGSAGMTNSQAIDLANRWIQIPSSSPIYDQAAADLTLPSLVSDLFNATTFHKGRILSIDGVRTISITYSNSGEDAGPASVDIALGGKHLPVASTINGITIRFTSWGNARLVRPPTGAVSLTSLVPSAEATT